MTDRWLIEWMDPPSGPQLPDNQCDRRLSRGEARPNPIQTQNQLAPTVRVGSLVLDSRCASAGLAGRGPQGQEVVWR